MRQLLNCAGATARQQAPPPVCCCAPTDRPLSCRPQRRLCAAAAQCTQATLSPRPQKGSAQRLPRKPQSPARAAAGGAADAPAAAAAAESPRRGGVAHGGAHGASIQAARGPPRWRLDGGASARDRDAAACGRRGGARTPPFCFFFVLGLVFCKLCQCRLQLALAGLSYNIDAPHRLCVCWFGNKLCQCAGPVPSPYELRQF